MYRDHRRILWCVLGFIIVSANAEMLQDDLQALIAFHNATDVSDLLGWDTGTNPCTWQGITCTVTFRNSTSVQERVSKINLPGSGLSGTIPTGVLGLLAELTVLSLRSNFLTGALPGDLVKCSKLKNLALQKNRFSGFLQWDFSLWPRLARLDLSYNNITGGLPQTISNLPRIKLLYLQNNSFAGNIPSIRFFQNSVEFNVANNRLSGEIPTTLSQFPAESFSGNPGLCGAPLNATCARPVPPPSPSTEWQSPRRGSKTKLGLGPILAIIIGDIAILGVLTTLFLLCYWHRQHKQMRSATKKEHSKESGKSSSDDFTKGDYSSSDLSGEPNAGKLVFLKTSKNNFSLEDLLRASAEVIGQGRLGSSYRAVLEDGQIVAVKRIRVEMGSKEFEHRMALFGDVEHPNLHSLRAYYCSKSEKLIVTEFLPRGSLALHLYGEGKASIALDWTARLRIALGVARGLSYLHETLSGQLVHGNMKSSNILLTRSLEPQISDFGLIQLLGPESALSASLPGYQAPEVVATKRFTHQSDVYAFGVVVLELLTGKAPWRSNHKGERIDLPRWVQSVVREEWTEEVFDQRILRYSEDEMVEMLQIALMCVSTLPGDRPKMKNVVKMIEDVRNWQGRSPQSSSSEELTSLDVPSRI